jgi:hypothetical protein
MNPQMRLVIMLAVFGASGSILLAAEPAAPPANEAKKAQKVDSEKSVPAETKSPQAGSETAAAPEKDADKESATDAVADEDKDPEPKRAATAADKAGSPQRFTPSEQVRADFDVSFPVDI